MFIEQVGEIGSGDIDAALDDHFAGWFQHFAQNSDVIENPFMLDLAKGPLRRVDCYPVYFVNGYKFHTVDHGRSKASTNSGVCIKGTNYSENSDYYGRLLEVVILEYPRLPIKRTVLFRCEWFDPTPQSGTRKHQRYPIVDINQRRRLRKYEPFVLASQASQVCYMSYPSLRRNRSDWLAVCNIKPRSTITHVPVVDTSLSQNGDEAFQETVANMDGISITVNLDIEPIVDPNGTMVVLEDVAGDEDEEDDDDEDVNEDDDESDDDI